MPTFQPSQEQQSVIELDSSGLVTAGPGTGKTRTAIEKALETVKSLRDDSRKQVLFLSFSNAAIERIRIDAQLSIPSKYLRRISFRTYHSLAADILRIYGRFVGLPSHIRIIDSLEEKLLALERAWRKEDIPTRLKDLASQQGILSFPVLVPLATTLLGTSAKIRNVVGRRYALILVDEFQDTSADQWQLLCLLGGDSQVIAFGDPNQIIYGSLHGATAARMQHFSEWKNVTPITFAVNQRCPRLSILTFAECMLDGRRFTGQCDDHLKLLPLNNSNQLRPNTAVAWMDAFHHVGDKKSIGIFVPSGKLAAELCAALREPVGVVAQFPVYGQVPRDDSAIDAIKLALLATREFAIDPTSENCHKTSLAYLAMNLTWNSRKSVDSAKVVSLSQSINAARNREGKFRELLDLVRGTVDLSLTVNTFVEALAEFPELKLSCKRIFCEQAHRIGRGFSKSEQLSLFDDFRNGRKAKGLEGIPVGSGVTQILNYHRTKGREFDHVIMIVEPYQESMHSPLEEQRRLYYVCATRAKSSLTIIYYSRRAGRVLAPALPLVAARPIAGIRGRVI